ncbi:MAG: hypothetical protein ACRCXD_01175 [Luteolibacter sp.]
MNENAGTFELQEPPSPEALVPDSPLETWMLVIPALLILILMAVFLLKKKKQPKTDPGVLRTRAFQEATAALDQIGHVPGRDAAIQSSLIVRKYLSTAAGDPALFETQEETISRHEALKDFSEEARAAAGRGFARLAALKYAAVPHDVEAVNITAESRDLLETLHHGFRA